MSISEDSKQKAWLEHFQRLLNVEFDWDQDHLYDQPPLEGLPSPIPIDMVKKAIFSDEDGQNTGPIRHSGGDDGREAGDTGISMTCDFAVAIIHDGKVPSDWEQSFIEMH